VDRRTVLIIDGPHRTVEIWTAVLSAHGYRVIIAVDGAEALWLLSGERPDLIVADVAQEYHGRPLLKSLQETPATRHIPIFAIDTAGRGDADAADGADTGTGAAAPDAAGSAHVLPEDMTPERIVKAVEQLIGSPER